MVKFCRICQSSALEPILDFGEMPLANKYPLNPSDHEIFLPLKVVLCMDCGCVQLAYTVDPKVLFEEYLYTSSTSGTLSEHFRQYARDTVEKLALKPGKDFIVGIGGNDGPLERAYQDRGFKVLNVEASKNISELSRANEVPTWNDWFTEEVAKEIARSNSQASLVTCNNCLAHVPDIHALLMAVKILLKPGGWFVSESAYWRDEVIGNHFDHIYHEHCFYWTIKALDELFRGHKMTITDVEFNNSQGGSIRVFAQHEIAATRSMRIHDAIAREESERLFEPSTYRLWTRRIEDWRMACGGFLVPLKSICCYGVPAKFAMLSQQLSFTPDNIQYAVEDSPIKVGRFTPGSHIPIVNNCHFIANPTKYCIITATNYADRIIKANPQYKGDWIVLTPEPRFMSL